MTYPTSIPDTDGLGGFLVRFGIPAAAVPHLDVFFTPTELAFGARVGEAPFTRDEAGALLAQAAEESPQVETDPDRFIAESYRRGFIDLVDTEAVAPTYRLGTFYGRLDVFAITQQDAWLTIPEKDRRALDSWYFDAYIDGLDPDPAAPTTQDTVLSLEETLSFIDEQERPIYLNTCDCRSLAGDCDSPVRTCLTYKSGPNTFCGRGLSEALTKEQAKDVVRMADRAGLMHTVNPNGICNCCSDCCYLFRGERARESHGVWPIVPNIIELDQGACIGCGRCTKRCHFDVFTFAGVGTATRCDRPRRVVTADTGACVGCGICSTTCPTGALTLIERTRP
ncbi:MAG: 4Fe-4S dicluster domain-containing protein [Coriobacteriaceae bacterium]|nr:4Fe-4S dicluster domain-containing protein [Coriobacteriaceae bacterium]